MNLSKVWATNWLQVAIVLVSLEIWIFGGYLIGSTVPPFDFDSYTAAAHYWWTHAKFLSPADWNPTLWSGYPEAAEYQNSSWYLPVGLLNFFSPYTLHIAAISAMLHVAFGSLGTYVLIKKIGASHSVALFGLVAGFFAVGYYSNAQHVDIMRAYAFIPWLVFSFTNAWPWKSRWGVAGASILWWQFAAGSYPGMILAFAFVLLGGGLVAIVWYRKTLRALIWRYFLAGLIAILLLMPKLAPFMVISDGIKKTVPDSSTFDIHMAGTAIFEFVEVDLGNDPSMRSFYVGATVVALLAFSNLNSNLFKLGLTLVALGAVFGIPGSPWFTPLQSVPGMSESRFTMSDFKPYIILGLLLIASSGLEAVIQKNQNRDKKTDKLRLALGISIFCGFLYVANLGKYSPDQTAFPMFIFMLVLALVSYAMFVKNLKSGMAIAVICLTAIGGKYWAAENSWIWKADRHEIEQGIYKESINNLISISKNSAGEAQQRPARQELPRPYNSSVLHSGFYNRAEYSGENYLGGYINLKKSTTLDKLESALLDEQIGSSFSKFMELPSSFIFTKSETNFSISNFSECLATTLCANAKSQPLKYEIGDHTFSMDVRDKTFAILNEPYYPGWKVSACRSDKVCEEISVAGNDQGLVTIALPEGEYELRLHYETPLKGESLAMMFIGFALLVSSLFSRNLNGFLSGVLRQFATIVRASSNMVKNLEWTKKGEKSKGDTA